MTLHFSIVGEMNPPKFIRLNRLVGLRRLVKMSFNAMSHWRNMNSGRMKLSWRFLLKGGKRKKKLMETTRIEITAEVAVR